MKQQNKDRHNRTPLKILLVACVLAIAVWFAAVYGVVQYFKGCA